MLKDDSALLMDLYPKIFFACHSRHVKDPDKKNKLTAHQANILDHLEARSTFTLQELAMHMGVTPSTMSINVERLVKLGYVKRIRDKKDNRRISLSLTKEGVKIRQGRSILDLERVQSVLMRLTAEERATALKGLSLFGFAAEMEMKNNSLNKAWNRKK